MGPNRDVMSLLNQMHSFAACVAATYSASAVERVTSSCLREAQEMAPPSSKKAEPEMAWRCSCDAPSASVNPIKLWRSFP